MSLLRTAVSVILFILANWAMRIYTVFQKKTSTHIIGYKLSDFNNFWHQNFSHYLKSHDSLVVHLTKLVCLHYLVKLIARVLKHGVDFVRGSVRLMTSSFSCLERMGYLAETIRPVSGLATRRHLRSADTSTLLVPTTYSPFDTGWPRVSGGCSKSLEFAALSC